MNDGKPRLITKLTPISFYISDSLKYENYISGGICEEIKVPSIKNFYPLKDWYYNPYIENKPNPFDFSKIGKSELIHCGILALNEFYEKNNNSLPKLNSLEMGHKILEIAKEIYNKVK